VRLKTGCYAMAWWYLIAMTGSSVVAMGDAGGGMLIAPAEAAGWWPSIAPVQAAQRGDTMQPEGATSVTPGMGKEAIRKMWGDPEEIRKIRTCFGWQEEWVYRGDAKRFGVSERVLLFDESEVLTEIK
jgi:hypothetical protein